MYLEYFIIGNKTKKSIGGGRVGKKETTAVYQNIEDKMSKKFSIAYATASALIL
jgi:hypothetical protein